MSTQPVVGWRADDSTFGARLALVRQRMGWGNVKEAALACGRAGSDWYAVDRDLVAVQRLLGHASVATTQIYVEPPADAMTSAVLGVA